MAEQTMQITFAWENDVEFKMDTKLNDDDKITVIKVEENGDIANLWSGIQSICEKTVTRHLDTIGGVMKGE